LTIVGPKLARLGPIEITHSELSRNINLEENGAQKGFQKVTLISNQKPRK